MEQSEDSLEWETIGWAFPATFSLSISPVCLSIFYPKQKLVILGGPAYDNVSITRGINTLTQTRPQLTPCQALPRPQT